MQDMAKGTFYIFTLQSAQLLELNHVGPVSYQNWYAADSSWITTYSLGGSTNRSRAEPWIMFHRPVDNTGATLPLAAAVQAHMQTSAWHWLRCLTWPKLVHASW